MEKEQMNFPFTIMFHLQKALSRCQGAGVCLPMPVLVESPCEPGPLHLTPVIPQAWGTAVRIPGHPLDQEDGRREGKESGAGSAD